MKERPDMQQPIVTQRRRVIIVIVTTHAIACRDFGAYHQTVPSRVDLPRDNRGMLRSDVTSRVARLNGSRVTTVRNMKWAEEVTLQFIDAYKSQEILWNSKHRSYYNKIKKNRAWSELAENFKTTTDECKRKITNLLSALRREKAKMKKTYGTGAGHSDVYECNWFAFKSLLFLWDKNNAVETEESMNDDEVKEELSGHATPITNSSNEVSGTLRLDNTGTGKNEKNQPREAKRKRPADDTKPEKAFEVLTKARQSVEREESECDIFGKLVSKKLCKYSTELQNMVQQDIMNILFQADRTHNNPEIPYYHSPYLHYTSNPIHNTTALQTVQRSPPPSLSSHALSHPSSSPTSSRISPVPSSCENTS